MWSVYLLLCYIKRTDQCTYYTGITTDFTRRIKQHRSGKGAKYTRSVFVVDGVVISKHTSRSAASKVEYKLKQQSHEDKRRLFEDKKWSRG